MFLRLISVLLTGLLLSSCGSSGNSGTNSTDAEKEFDISVVFSDNAKFKVAVNKGDGTEDPNKLIENSTIIGVVDDVDGNLDFVDTDKVYSAELAVGVENAKAPSVKIIRGAAEASDTNPELVFEGALPESDHAAKVGEAALADNLKLDDTVDLVVKLDNSLASEEKAQLVLNDAEPVDFSSGEATIEKDVVAALDENKEHTLAILISKSTDFDAVTEATETEKAIHGGAKFTVVRKYSYTVEVGEVATPAPALYDRDINLVYDSLNKKLNVSVKFDSVNEALTDHKLELGTDALTFDVATEMYKKEGVDASTLGANYTLKWTRPDAPIVEDDIATAGLTLVEINSAVLYNTAAIGDSVNTALIINKAADLKIVFTESKINDTIKVSINDTDLAGTYDDSTKTYTIAQADLTTVNVANGLNLKIEVSKPDVVVSAVANDKGRTTIKYSAIANVNINLTN